MKMLRALGRTVKPFVNFPKWMGLKGLVKNANDIKVLASSIVDQSATGQHETFQEAVARLSLTSGHIAKRRQEFYFLSVFFTLIGLIVLVYVAYHLYVGNLVAALIALILAAVAFAMAFRNHFWYVQITHERLGVHWRDWLRIFMGKLL